MSFNSWSILFLCNNLLSSGSHPWLIVWIILTCRRIDNYSINFSKLRDHGFTGLKNCSHETFSYIVDRKSSKNIPQFFQLIILALWFGQLKHVLPAYTRRQHDSIFIQGGTDATYTFLIAKVLLNNSLKVLSISSLNQSSISATSIPTTFHGDIPTQTIGVKWLKNF